MATDILQQTSTPESKDEEEPLLDSDSFSPPFPSFCTHAITGSQYPSHQPIYICDTCHRARLPGDDNDDGGEIISSTYPRGVHDDDDDDNDADNYCNAVEDSESPSLPCCICQSCAEVCHADHDVTYVGIGPCTCDCLYLQSHAAAATTDESDANFLKQDGDENKNTDEMKDDCGDETKDDNSATCCCKLADHSHQEAVKLGFSPCRPLHAPLRLNVPLPISETDVLEKNDDTNDDRSLLQLSTRNDYNITCIECNSTLGGYVYDSYTICPGNIISPVSDKKVDFRTRSDGNDEEKGLHSFCDNLIAQAIALDACSQDTFWMPSSMGDSCNEHDDIDNVDKGGNTKSDKIDMCNNILVGGYCDLELFAREVYQHHVQSYMSHLTTSKNEINTQGGAEWWVQVKPAGSSHAPVNLHYDKDETLAESFGLGSFPTLSTVTYLTDAQDNVPTIVFPRTYDDELDLPIESMLVSHAVKGKQLVFDGRLLHGAPAHQSLLRQRCNRNRKDGDDENDDESQSTSSLRVTLLVNIWLSGKPACVNVLPELIRSRIKCAAKTEPIMARRSLGFRKRHVSKFRAGASAKSNYDSINTASREMIVLPFVSNGDAYADIEDGDIDEAIVVDEDKMSGEEVVDTNDGGGTSPDKLGDDAEESEVNEEDDEDDEEDDEDDKEELYLVLSQFSPADDLKDEADTFVISFGDGNGARIIRGGALDETYNRQQCPWKKLTTRITPSDVGVNESCITDATSFLSYLQQNVPSFITSVLDELKIRHEMDVAACHADHICYRTGSIEQYSSLVAALRAATCDFRILTESEVGGRPIATFKLTTPIMINTIAGNIVLDVIEIPSPKEGSPYHEGLEHVEFVIGDGSHTSPVNSETHRIALTNWMERYPTMSWNRKALNKVCNPDVSASLGIPRYGIVAVKFHLIPLEEVIKFEESSDN